MNNPFNHLLTRLTKLPPADQRWIWKQLSTEQRRSFKKNKGIIQLQAALGGLPSDRSSLKPIPDVPQALPTYCAALAIKDPLYIAIVLEQGSYPWQTQFLTEFDSEGEISRLLSKDVFNIKFLVRQALFKEWESSCFHLDFEQFLEEPNG